MNDKKLIYTDDDLQNECVLGSGNLDTKNLQDGENDNHRKLSVFEKLSKSKNKEAQSLSVNIVNGNYKDGEKVESSCLTNTKINPVNNNNSNSKPVQQPNIFLIEGGLISQRIDNDLSKDSKPISKHKKSAFVNNLGVVAEREKSVPENSKNGALVHN